MSKALRSLEKAAVVKMSKQLRSLQGRMGASLAKAVRENPDKTFAALWRDLPELDSSLQKSIKLTQERIRATIKSSSLAASKLAQADLSRDYGIKLKDPVIDVDDLLNDVDGYMQVTLEAIKLEISRALQLPLTDRRRAIEESIAKVVRGLALRASASASITMVRTYNQVMQEGLQSVVAGETKLRKTWQVTSDNPCKKCRALNGKTVDLDANFHRAVHTPPMHVRCACVIVLKPES